MFRQTSENGFMRTQAQSADCVCLWSLWCCNLTCGFRSYAHTPTYQTVLFPGLWELGPLLLPGHEDLHVLKCWVVPCLCLEGHLVLWHRLS